MTCSSIRNQECSQMHWVLNPALHWAWAYRLLKFLKYCVVVYNWLSLVLDVQCCGKVFESLLISLCLTIKIKNTCSALLKYLMYKAAADWEPKISFLSSSPLATDFKSLSLFSLFLLVTGSTEGPDAFQVLCHFFAGFCSVSQGHEFALDGFLHLPTCATSWKKMYLKMGIYKDWIENDWNQTRNTARLSEGLENSCLRLSQLQQINTINLPSCCCFMRQLQPQCRTDRCRRNSISTAVRLYNIHTR